MAKAIIKRRSAASTKQKPASKPGLDQVDRLHAIICDLNILFGGIRVSPKEDDYNPEMAVIRAAAEHGYRKSSEALELADEIKDALNGKGAQP